MADGGTFELHRWVERFVLRKGEETVARAHQAGTFGGHRLALEYEDDRGRLHHYTFERPPFRDGFELGWGGAVLGKVSREGFFRIVTVVDLPGEVPTEVGAFLAWVAEVLWESEESAGNQGSIGTLDE